MAKFAVFFTLKGETVKNMMSRPSDRAAVVSAMCEQVGGRMESYYMMFGSYDGFVVVDIPDSSSAAAISLAVSSTGAFGHIETHELIDVSDINGILETASGLSYSPPGS
jgi:uncharacterized protein with GYD domain